MTPLSVVISATGVSTATAEVPASILSLMDTAAREPGLADTYVVESDPFTAFQVVNPNELHVGGDTGSARMAWFGFSTLPRPVPDDAVALRIQMHLIGHVPVWLGPDDAPTLYVNRVGAFHSEVPMTHASLVGDETTQDNWPLDVLGQYEVEIPVAPSNPSYPELAPTHVRQSFVIDVTEWWRHSETDPGHDLRKGFVLSSSPMPVQGGEDSYIIFLSREVPTTVAGAVHGVTAPFLSVEYGYPVKTFQLNEITPESTLLTWDGSEGADSYVIQSSPDGLEWNNVGSATEPEFRFDTSSQTRYWARVASVYEGFGVCGEYSSPVSWLTPSVDAPTTYLSAPPAPKCEEDKTRGQVVLTLSPVLESNVSVDRWQISRRPEAAISDANAPLPLDSDVIAEVPFGVTKWIDRFPQSYVGTYNVRGRVDTEANRWTPWSANADYPVVYTRPARPGMLTPNMGLALSANYITGSPVGGHVETSLPDRFPVIGGVSYHLEAFYRSIMPAATAESFDSGLRWYDRDGLYISEDSVKTWLFHPAVESPRGFLNHSAVAPSGSVQAGMFFRFHPDVNSYSVLVFEYLALYKEQEGAKTGWDYVQVPDSEGMLPDLREETVEQDVFTYNGVGWGPVRAPATAPLQTAPYRASSTADDDVTLIQSGQYLEFLFYGNPKEAVVELARLGDSVLQETVSPESSIWIPIVDENVGTFAYGSELLANGSFENNTTGWTTVPSVLGTDPQNGLTASGGTITRITTSPITGTASAQIVTGASVGAGATYPLMELTFLAGHTYRLNLKYQFTGVDTSKVLDILFGSTSPSIGAPSASTYYDYSKLQTLSPAPTAATVATLYWTPKTDVSTVYVSIRTPSPANRTYLIDEVSVKEVVGYKLPASADFEVLTLRTPPVFSAYFPTSYRVKLVSGTMRPFGARRDTQNVLDITNDFDPVLRAMGNIRNASRGELEFRSDSDPPLVKHYEHRGVDHSKVDGGVDFRYGKNVTSSRRALDPGQVVNRLIVLGYGDDRTQLVHEARAQKDFFQRLPSDIYYRHDADGRSPTDSNWDVNTGGTSYEIFGVRYGIHRDSNLQSLYRASELGKKIVEESAWPQETYDVSVTDLAEVPEVLDVGDIVPFRYRGKEYTKRIHEITTDIAQPRQLALTLGEPEFEAGEAIDRAQKDIDTTLSFINDTTGAADEQNAN